MANAARRLVVERNLVRAAFEYLTVDAFLNLPFEALAPTKQLLKRFFSAEPWGPEDDEALAAVVGPGEGEWRRSLDADLTLEYGWHEGRFRVRVESGAPGEAPAAAARRDDNDPLAATFDGPVVPEATPNPRTIRFQVGPIHDGPSRWYESAASAAGDASVSRLFSAFDEVANVLVGPDFVAVGLHRPSDWERLLHPLMTVVAEEFAPDDDAGGTDQGPPRVTGGPAGAGVAASGTSRAPGARRVSRLERAWQELGSLRPAEPQDVAHLLAAAQSEDSARRQVAANLLREADPEVAAQQWAALVVDPVRSVRRSAVDAMVDVERPALRPLLESALSDRDAWVRWKALRGLAQLDPRPSRRAISACADDPDFRVRLEAAAALRPG